MKRASGIILPITSLPSPYGVGTMGKAAQEFIDFLVEAKQTWWQILPVGPTSYGDSPYQSPSTYAGNPYLIDLELLIDEGLLTKEEVNSYEWGSDASQVDYGLLYENRLKVLLCAYERGRHTNEESLAAFVQSNSAWLFDYALFMALKEHFSMKSWDLWDDEDIRLRKGHALEAYRQLLAPRMDFYIYIQYLFFKQWDALREYAHSKGVGIIGDLPIYVAYDSADVWANPECFQLDEKNVPVAVSGVPPDSFTADGQLWGNPLYNYDVMAQDGYGWWIRRIGASQRLYDIVRIDHFRGFESYWSVPYGDKTAKDGHWVKGPGMSLVGPLLNWFSDVSFIAEDLGYHTPEVKQLLDDSGLPGMKVLEFAFDSGEPSDYRPHTYPYNCVCYTGTHDNAPLAQWLKGAKKKDLALAKKYLGVSDDKDVVWAFLRSGMSSVANLFVAQIQDYLELDTNARINTPGSVGNNWKWRLKKGQLNTKLAKKIADMTVLYGRDCEQLWPKSV